MYPLLILLFIISLPAGTVVRQDEAAPVRRVAVEEIGTGIDRFISEQKMEGLEKEELLGILEFEDFYGTAIDGSIVNVTKPDKAGYVDKPVVIFAYHAEWCPNCRYNLPVLKRVYEKYRTQGLQIILNYVYSNEERVRHYLTENEIQFPALIGSEDRDVNPAVRLQTTHYVLRSVLDDRRNWGTPFYIIYIRDEPEYWYIVSGEMIEEEIVTLLERTFFDVVD